MLKNLLKLFFQRVRLTFLLFAGTVSWALTMVKSGWIYPYGMGFWGANGHDGIWHLALAESLSRGTLENPVFASNVLENYHFGFDFLLALLHKVSGISIINLYFQILPPLFALLIGILTYKFVLVWKKSEDSAIWAVFFTYFGGSFAWILGKGESTFWAQQAISTLINPPYALSLIFTLSGLIFFLRYHEQQKSKYLLLSILFFGFLAQIKIYASLLVLFGLLTAFLLETLRGIKNSKLTKIFLGTLILSLFLFTVFTKNSGGLIVWQPFWFLETMMGLSDRVGWERFYSAMTAYRSGINLPKMILTYGFAFLIFVVGNMGTRILAFFKYFKMVFWKKADSVEIFLLLIIAAGIVIPMFFLQKGTPWNTIQFFYYSLFFSGILAGAVFNDFIRKFKLNTLLLYSIEIGLIFFTIPTTLITLKNVYIPERPPAMISNGELEALEFLANQDPGVVLTYPFDPVASKNAETKPPRPLYLYESTAYVSAFSGQQTYLEDEVNLNITGYDWKTRRAQVQSWYKEVDQNKAREFLLLNNIKYVYWVKPQSSYLGEIDLGLERIFVNNEAEVFMVKSTK